MYNYNTAGPGGGPIPRLDGSASPTDYPYGKAKNDDPPGSGNGTPVQIETAGDPMQALYACLVNTGSSPNGLPENVNNSDFLKALRSMFFSIGDLKWHYGSSSPSLFNWLPCNGGTFSSIDYPELAAFLGGTTLPDFRGRAIVALDSTEPSFDAIGGEGGAITHTLNITEMPIHRHSIDMGDDLGGSRIRSGQDTISDDNTSYEGGGQPHNNLQPYKVAMLFIKAK